MKALYFLVPNFLHTQNVPKKHLVQTIINATLFINYISIVQNVAIKTNRKGAHFDQIVISLILCLYINIQLMSANVLYLIENALTWILGANLQIKNKFQWLRLGRILKNSASWYFERLNWSRNVLIDLSVKCYQSAKLLKEKFPVKLAVNISVERIFLNSNVPLEPKFVLCYVTQCHDCPIPELIMTWKVHEINLL